MPPPRLQLWPIVRGDLSHKSKELKLEEGDPSITCSGSASHICEIDLGVVLCPKTCGYCAPFEYEHAVFFDKPQVTMLPVMVHQTRYPMSACDFFAETFETQPFNRDLATSPPLDGVRNGRVLTCIDRNKQLDDEFAFQLECPKEGAPENMCANGKMPFSKVRAGAGSALELSNTRSNLSLACGLQATCLLRRPARKWALKARILCHTSWRYVWGV